MSKDLAGTDIQDLSAVCIHSLYQLYTNDFWSFHIIFN